MDMDRDGCVDKNLNIFFLILLTSKASWKDFISLTVVS